MTPAMQAAHAGATILVVDDNAALLRSIERVLRMEGYQVCTAHDGDEALALLEQSGTLPDLIISDVAMPRMDGFTFFQHVRQRREWLPIPFVFLTARDQEADLRTGYALGADDYLVKPLDQVRLLLIIENKLQRRDQLAQHLANQQQALEAVRHNLALLVAHELRTPLVSITMVSEMLANDLERMTVEQVRELLTLMQGGSMRLNRLVHQMELSVQLQMGLLQREIGQLARVVDLSAIVAEAMALAGRWDYRQRQIRLIVQGEIPAVTVRVERLSMVHAIAEVLHNGIMFAPQGSQVLIEAWQQGGKAWLAVTDSGPGIPLDEIERIFEPFYQIDRARFEQQGIGMGLALAKSILAGHGGTIAVDTQYTRGTRMVLSLAL